MSETHENCIRDLWIGLATVAASGIYLAFVAGQVSAETDGSAGVSGRTLPYVAGGVLLLLGTCLSISSFIRGRAAERVGSVIVPRSSLIRVLIYVAAITVYTLGISAVGYVISTGIMLLFTMYFSGTRNRTALLVLTLSVPPIMYLIFHVVMQIPLPEAPLF